MWFFVWVWPCANATVLLQFSGAVFTYYIFLTVIESVWLKIFDVGADFNLIVMFFVWCTLCQRVLQSLSRRIAIGIAQVEGHPVQWYDLLRSQCFLFRAYTFQGAYYRLIFQKVDTWESLLLLIAMHILQEVLLYPVRLLPRVREFERWFLSRSRIGRRILSPVLPMSVWMDIHYLDFFLKKVADISTLLLFVARCLICRYASWVSDCYTPRKWTSKLFLELLLVVSGVLFVSEMASGLVSMYFFRSVIAIHQRHGSPKSSLNSS